MKDVFIGAAVIAVAAIVTTAFESADVNSTASIAVTWPVAAVLLLAFAVQAIVRRVRRERVPVTGRAAGPTASD